MVIGPQENCLSLRIAKLHFSPQLFKRSKDFQLEPPPDLGFNVELLKDLLAKGFNISECLT